MVTVKGFQDIGIFDQAAQVLLKHTSKSRTLIRLLISICFFSSMLITNDVALITFVPFTVLVLKKSHLEQHMIYTIVMQTIAANLGSMLTPLGNPQNLYLYGISINSDSEQATRNKDLICYILLFLVDLIVVFRLIPWWIAFIVTILLVLLIKRSFLFRQVDYALLISFVGFFIFVGNIGRIPFISQSINHIITDREILVSALFSQFMSNVPTAILLSGFTTNVKALIVGTNIGGLGTLIASMASLISYKIYVETPDSQKEIYVRVFTLYNVIGLLILLSFTILQIQIHI